MKKLFIALMLCFISLLFAEDILEGFRDYKFGMTFAEADTLYDDDELSSNSIEQKSLIYNVKVTLYVHFDLSTKKLDKITICSEHYEDKDRYFLIDEIIQEYIKKLHGEPSVSSGGHTFWLFNNGGYIEKVSNDKFGTYYTYIDFADYED